MLHSELAALGYHSGPDTRITPIKDKFSSLKTTQVHWTPVQGQYGSSEEGCLTRRGKSMWVWGRRRYRRIVASGFPETELRFEGWDSQTKNYLVAETIHYKHRCKHQPDGTKASTYALGERKTKGKTSIHTFHKNELIVFLKKEKEQKNRYIWVHLKSRDIRFFRKSSLCQQLCQLTNICFNWFRKTNSHLVFLSRMLASIFT